MIGRWTRRIAPAACILALAACTSGPPSTFSVSSASVDPSYSCPTGASNAHYDLHGTIDVRNGTSKSVTISSIDATLTLAAVKGGWLQRVGDRYDAGSVTFTPDSVDTGQSSTLTVTVPSACTGRSAGSPSASGDYAVTFTISTSAGTFKISSTDRHRITTA